MHGGVGELSARNQQVTMGLSIKHHKGRFGTQSISDIILMRRGVTF